jgi:hypothetical protein
MACCANGSSPFTVKANLKANEEDHLPEPELIGQMTYESATELTVLVPYTYFLK